MIGSSIAAARAATLAATRASATAEALSRFESPASAVARRAPAPPHPRLREVDVLRGLVMLLMLLDHTRDYFHADAFAYSPLDPARTTPLLYATRWVTHLCAPTFVLLAGVSAWLQLERGKPARELSWLLATRGLWLVALELTVVSFGWSWSLPYPPFLQVIWAIGWSMLALSALVWAPRWAVLAVGVAIVCGHNLLDPVVPEQLGAAAWLWTLLHEGGVLRIGGTPVGMAAYPVLPWIGVMAFGYGLGAIFEETPRMRDRRLLSIGLAMLAAFVVLRALNLYGDPQPWTTHDDRVATAMSFLDVKKYPPSLLYLLATLGIAMSVWPLLVRLPRTAASVLAVFGAVPLFFYVVHVDLVHAAAMAANAAAGRDASGLIGYLEKGFTAPESVAGLGFPLAVVYVATVAIGAMLYPLCRWWRHVKRTRRHWALSYL
jgi:uncharacterized membrane protein